MFGSLAEFVRGKKRFLRDYSTPLSLPCTDRNHFSESLFIVYFLHFPYTQCNNRIKFHII